MMIAAPASAELNLFDVPTAFSASSQYNGAYAVDFLFDGAITTADIGTANNLGAQYAGLGIGPHTVYMDFNAPITANSFVYSQRGPFIDAVAHMEFWFESSDPGGAVVPVRPADEIVALSNMGNNLLTLESFAGGALSSQYVVMRMTGPGSANPGGFEFRFAFDEPIVNAEIPLTVDVANTTAPGFGSTTGGLLSDAFVYNPDDPTSASPAQTWLPTDQIYITPTAGGGIVDLDFDAVHDNIILDLWGRNDYAGAEDSRHHNLDITFYNGELLTHQVISWDGVSLKTDDPASYGQYIPPADVLADRVTIGHSTDYLLLAEIRAAAAPTVFDDVTWLGGSDNWSAGAKWDSAAQPQDNENAIVDTLDDLVTVAAPGAVAQSLAVSNGADLAVTAGNDLTLAGAATFSGAGSNLTVSGALTAGSLSVDDTVIVSGGGVITAGGGTLNNVTIGAGNGTISAGGDITAGALTILDNSTFIKTGGAKLSFNALGAIGATGTSIRVSAGELNAGGAPGVASVQLDGGTTTFSVGGGSLGPAGAAAHYSFDNTNGATVYNDGSNGGANDGVLTDGAALTAGSGGKIGEGMTAADNTAQRLTAGSGGIDIGEDWTVGMWFYNLHPTGNWRTATRGSGVGGHQIILANGGNELGTYAGGYFGSGTFLAAGGDAWHHITAVGSGTTTKFYIDGLYVNESAAKDTSDVLSIGNHWSTTDVQPFAEIIDEVYVYNSALDSDQVLELFNASGAAVSGNLVMTGTDFSVTADSTLEAVVDIASSASFGPLTIDDGMTLTIESPGTGVSFTSLAPIAAAARADIASANTPVNINSALTLGQDSTFAFSGDTITFTGVALSGTSATIGVNSTVNLGGALAIGPAQTLHIDGTGAVNTSELQATGTVASPAVVNFSGGATLTALAFNDSGAPAKQLNVTGSGTLVLDGSTGGVVAADNTTFSIGSEATLEALGTSPLGGGSTVSLDGGTSTFSIGGIDSAPAGAVAAWMFENAGDLGYDSAKPSRVTSYVGTPTQNANGIRGAALQLDGNDQMINVGSDSDYDTSTFTVAAWLNADDLVGWRTAFGTWGNPNWIHFGLNDNDRWGDHGGLETSDGTETVTPGKWYFVASVRNATTGKAQLWVGDENNAPTLRNEGDGVAAAGPGGRSAYIGTPYDHLGNDWKGLIDDLYFYDTALTGVQLGELYNIDGAKLAGNLLMPDTDFSVTDDSTLNAVVDSASSASFGALTLTGGTLTIESRGTGVNFTSLAPIAPAATVGIASADTPVNINSSLALGQDSTFNFSGDTITFTGLELSGTSATIGVNSTVNLGGAVALGAGDTLNIDGSGVVETTDLQATGTLASPATIDFSGGATLTAASFHDGGGTKPAANQLDLTGAGTLALDASGGGAIDADGTIFSIGDGARLKAAYAAGGAMGAAGTTLSLDGGTFETSGEGIGSYTFNQLRLTRYNSGTTPNSPADLDDGVDGNGLNGGLFLAAPDVDQFWSDNLQGPELGGGDYFAEMYSGNFHAPYTGAFNFQQWGDDFEAIWIDLNQNGEFEASNGEAIILNVGPEAWNVTKTGSTPSLIAGDAYGFAALFREGGGGEYSNFQIDMDAGGGINYQYINPGSLAQDGWWSSGNIELQPIDMSTTDISVNANSNLVAKTHSTATFGSVTLNSGILTVSRAFGGTIFAGDTTVPAGATSGVTSIDPLSLGVLTIGEGADVTVGGPANTDQLIVTDDVGGDNATSATIRANGVFTVNSYSDGANTVSLTQAGTGTMKLLGLGATAADGTSYRVQNGGMLELGENTTPLGGSTEALNFDGGTIKITGEVTRGGPAGELNIDFGNSNGADTGLVPLQAGFDAFLALDGGALVTKNYASGLGTVAAGDTVDVSIQGNSHLRNYAPITSGDYVSLSDLLVDHVMHNANGTINITLADLEDGIYEITTYHHNTQYGGAATFDLKLTDSNGADQLLFSGVDSSEGTAPASITSKTFQFEVSGGNDVIMKFGPGGGGGNHIAVNGFELAATKTVGAINLPGVDVNVTNTSTLDVVSDTTALFGKLILDNGVLTVDGPAGGTTFTTGVGGPSVTDGANTGIYASSPITWTQGGLAVTNTGASASQNMRLSGSFAIPGPLTLGDNVKVSVSDGVVTAPSLALTGPAASNNTVAFNDGTLTVKNYDDGGAARTITIERDGVGDGSITGFGGDGTGWTLNGGATIAGDVLTLTTEAGVQARSVFRNEKVDVRHDFTVSFTYESIYDGVDPADGGSFILQNAGLNALGAVGGGLAMQGILDSAIVQWDIYQDSRVKYTADGVLVTGDLTTPDIDLRSHVGGGPVDFVISYDSDAGTMTVDLTKDANSKQLIYNVGNLAAEVGDTEAYMGFTGATGGSTAEQRITNLSWDHSGANYGTLSLDTTAGGTVVAGNTTFHVGAGTTLRANSNPGVSPDGPLGAGGATISLDGGTATFSHTGGVAPAPAGAVAAWLFEDAGNLGYDSAKPGRVTSYAGAPTQNANGVHGAALQLNGASQINVGSDADYDTSTFTVAAWLNTDDVNAGVWHTAFGQWNNPWWIHFGLDGDQQRWGDHGGIRTTDGTETVTPGKWYFVASVRNAATGKAQLWVGDETNAPTLRNEGDGVAPAGPGGNTVFIGSPYHALTNDWKGLIDDLYFYDSALTGAQLLELSNAGAELTGNLAMGDTDLIVTADSALVATTETTAVFGLLDFADAGEGGMLTLSGAEDSISFADTTVSIAPTGDIGFNTASDTYPGQIDFGGFAATIVKSGDADLILDPGNPLGLGGDVGFDVRGGRVIAQAGSNPFGVDSSIGINGGEVVLVSSAPVTPAVFDNPVTSGGGALTAGANGGANVGALTVTLGNATGNDLTLTGGTLTIQTTDDYTLDIAGNVLGGGAGGGMTIGAGSTVNVAGLIDAGTVTIDGSLAVAGTVTVNELIANAGATYSGPSDLTVTQTLTLNSDLDLSAATLVVDGANVTVSNGTLTLGAGNDLGAGTPVAGVDVSDGGGLAMGGNSLTTTRLKTTGGLFDMGATGSFIATGNVTADAAPGLGPVQLELTGGTLSVKGPGLGMPADLQFHIDASDINNDGGATNPANGAAVTDWADISGNGNDADQNWNAPVYNTAGPNGMPVVTFTDDVLSTSHNFNALEGYTILTVARYTGGASERIFGSLDRNWLFGYWRNGVNKWHADAWILNGAGTDTDWHLHVGTITNDADPKANLWNNGVNVVTDSTGSHNTLYRMDRLALGGWRDNNEMSDSEIAEALIFEGVLTAEEINRIGGYLADKYGLGGTGYTGFLSQPMSLPGTDLLMTAETAIDVADNVTLGNLIVNNASPATLTFTGDAENSLKLTSTTFTAELKPDVGLTIDNSPKVNLGTLNLGGTANPVIEKVGGGDWIITDTVGGYTGNATYNVNAGTLVLGSKGLIGSTVNMGDGTTLKLSSSAGDPSYLETINFTGAADGTTTILAGKADDNSAAGAVVTLPGPLNQGGQNVTLSTTDETYTLAIVNAVIAKSLTLSGVGTVTLAAGGSANTATVNATGTINVPNTLSVTDKLTLGDINITDNANMQVTGTNLATQTGTVKVWGSAFTMRSDGRGEMPDGALVYYSFDTVDAGQTPNEGSAGAGADGNIVGAVVAGAGQIGGALDFNGGQVITQNVVNMGATQTIACWVNSTVNQAAWRRIVLNDSYQNGVYLGTDPTGNTYQSIVANNFNVLGGAVNDAPNVWQHLAITYDGASTRLYVDGALVGGPLAMAAPISGNRLISVGNNHPGMAEEGWRGLVDEVFVYNRTLDVGEIQTLYNSGLAGAYPGEPIDMPNLNLDLAMGGPTASITLNAATAALGDLTTGAVTDLTIAAAESASFNNVTIKDGGATTINNGGAAIGLTVRGTLATGDLGGDLTTDFSVNGDLTMSTGSTLMAFGAAVTAKNFTNDGGDVEFDTGSSLNLTASTLSQNTGTTTFGTGSSTSGIDAIDVTGGVLETAGDVSTGTLNVSQGATLTAVTPVSVSTQATFGDGTAASLSGGPAFGVGGSNVVAARELTLNGGTMTLSGPISSTPGEFVPLANIAATAENNQYAPITNTTAWVGMDRGSQGAPDKDALQNNVYANKWTPGNGNFWGKWHLDNTASNTSFDLAEIFWWQYNQDGSPNRGIPTARLYYSNAAADPGNPRDNAVNWTLFYDNTVGTGLPAWPLAPTSANDHTVVELPVDITARWISILPTTPATQDGNGLGTILFTQADSGPFTLDLSDTTIVAEVSSTLELAGGVDAVTLGGIEVDDAVTLTIGGAIDDFQLTNLILDNGSMVKSTLTAATAAVDVTVSEKLSTGGGNSNVGDPGDEFGAGADTFFTSLTLIDGAVPADADVEWTFTSGALSDVDGGGMMVAIDDTLHVYGTLNLAAGLTIQLVDDLPAGVNVSGVDIALFKVSEDAIIDGVVGSAWTPADIAKITVLSPVGAPVEWTWGSLAYLNDEFVVLTNLVTGVHPGDANGDQLVNEEDLVLLNAQWGERGAGLSCDFDGDGDVDVDDFQILNAQWGYDGTGGGGAPVMPGSETPEPATMSLLALGGLLILRRRRRKL
ncbi:MAG: PEP-CTERM sorting domain-containing protein [Phycisphaerae bacterium]|jgi:hypothetical protein|nr:PEP-CTERM sorting domain-containing protein [Phycisphaerae bacterium]